MPFLPQWKKSVITAVKCGCDLHMFSFILVGVVSASVTVGSGVVLCSSRGICRLSIPHRSPSKEVKKSSCASARYVVFHHVVTSSSLISSFSFRTT